VTAFDLAWAPPLPDVSLFQGGSLWQQREREEERTEANDSVCSFNTAMIEPDLT
jgi:hypothetical protein